jgi:phospholipase/carboxylesterase
VLLFHGVGAIPRALVPLGSAAGRASSRKPPLPACRRRTRPTSARACNGSRCAASPRKTARRGSLRSHAALRRCRARAAARRASGPTATILVGFSQGAILALDSARLGHRLASRIVALAGRFSELPATVPAGIVFHLLHGADDPVIPARQCDLAAQVLASLDAEVTADVLPATGHTVSPAMEELLVRRLAAAATRP